MIKKHFNRISYKRRIFYLIAIFILSFFCIWIGLKIVGKIYSSPTTVGQPKSFVRVAVIDVQRVKRESRIFQRLAKIASDKHKLFYDEISKLEAELRNEHEKLVKYYPSADSTNKTESLGQGEKQKFEKKVAELEKLVEQKKQTLQDFLVNAYREVEKQVQETVKELSDHYKFELILDSGLVLYSASNNLTKEMIRLLDEKTKNLYNDSALDTIER